MKSLSPNINHVQRNNDFLFRAKAGSQQDAAPVEKSRVGNLVPGNAGFSFTHIPVFPQRQTHEQVQCCAKDGAGCSCPQCQAAAEASKDRDGLGDISATEQAAPEQSTTEQTEEASSATEVTETEESEAGNEPQQTIAGLIVDDSVTDLSEGQIRKTAFLQNLRSAICNTIGPVLATVGQTTDGCPYLNYWLDLYQEKDAAHIEKTARKYAPDVAGATTAEAYITIISQRALRAAEIWVRTGRLSGIPDGVPTTLPGESPAPVQAKAKIGGVRRADDPQVIKQQLGEGQPLSSGVRSRMEAAFGTSFSNVRTHTDSTASGLSSQVNARAFTVGNHIAFGSGEYQPETPLGDALIAHELAHTIQQKGAENSVDKMETGDDRYNQLEADADKTATSVVTSLWTNPKSIKTLVPALRSGLKIQRCSSQTVNQKENACTTSTSPPTPVKTMTIRPTYLWGGSTNAHFTSQLTYANKVYKTAGIDIKAGNAETINEADTKTILGTNAMLNVSGDPPRKASYTAEEKALLAKNTASNEVSMYYIKKKENIPSLWALAYVDSDAVIQENTTTDRVLAHEVGHLIAGLGHPSNLDNIMAQTSVATGKDCLSDDQIEAARNSHLVK